MSRARETGGAGGFRRMAGHGGYSIAYARSRVSITEGEGTSYVASYMEASGGGQSQGARRPEEDRLRREAVLRAETRRRTQRMDALREQARLRTSLERNRVLTVRREIMERSDTGPRHERTDNEAALRLETRRRKQRFDERRRFEEERQAAEREETLRRRREMLEKQDALRRKAAARPKHAQLPRDQRCEGASGSLPSATPMQAIPTRPVMASGSPIHCANADGRVTPVRQGPPQSCTSRVPIPAPSSIGSYLNKIGGEEGERRDLIKRLKLPLPLSQGPASPHAHGHSKGKPSHLRAPTSALSGPGYSAYQPTLSPRQACEGLGQEECTVPSMRDSFSSAEECAAGGGPVSTAESMESAIKDAIRAIEKLKNAQSNFGEATRPQEIEEESGLDSSCVRMRCERLLHVSEEGAAPLVPNEARKRIHRPPVYIRQGSQPPATRLRRPRDLSAEEESRLRASIDRLDLEAAGSIPVSRRSRLPYDDHETERRGSVYDSLESHNLMMSIERLDLRLASVKDSGSQKSTHRSAYAASSSESNCSTDRSASSGGSSARSVLHSPGQGGSRIPMTFKARSMSAPHGRASGGPKSLTSKYFAPSSSLFQAFGDKIDGSTGPGRQRRGQQGHKVRGDALNHGVHVSTPATGRHLEHPHEDIETPQGASHSGSGKPEEGNGRVTLYSGARDLFPIAESTSVWAFTTQQDCATAEVDEEGLL